MLVIFDVEGVLLNAEYLPVLAKLLGPKKKRKFGTLQIKVLEEKLIGRKD